jgi:hypothetical protein
MLSSYDEFYVSKWLGSLIARVFEEMAGGVTRPNTASRAPVCDALAKGRDCLRLFRSRVKITQIPSISELRDASQSDRGVYATSGLP